MNFVDVLIGIFRHMFKGLTLKNAQLAVLWAPQWLSTEEERAQAQIYHIGQEFGTETIRLVGTGTVDKHVYNFQRQPQEFDVRMLGVRVKGQEVMSREEQLEALGKLGD